jgi:hypothetical protein
MLLEISSTIAISIPSEYIDSPEENDCGRASAIIKKHIESNLKKIGRCRNFSLQLPGISLNILNEEKVIAGWRFFPLNRYHININGTIINKYKTQG